MRHANLFVYGTMLKGQRNHWRVALSEFLGPAETVEPYYMSVNPHRMIPYVDGWVRDEYVSGELYRVDWETLRMIDRYEGHPTCYERRQEQVIVGGYQIFDAWIYFNEKLRGVLPVPCGDFRSVSRPVET